MADVESKLRRDITPMLNADPLLGSVPSEASAVMRYLASFLMTAVATVVAVGVDSAVTIPNLSLVFVVPVIIAGVAFGLGPAVCSALLGDDGTLAHRRCHRPKVKARGRSRVDSGARDSSHRQRGEDLLSHLLHYFAKWSNRHGHACQSLRLSHHGRSLACELPGPT